MTDELDLDKIAEEISTFYDELEEIIDENKRYHTEQKTTDQRLYAYDASQKVLNEEISNLQEMISNYQKTLYKHNHIQEENVHMKSRIDELVKEKTLLEQEVVSANEKFIEEFQRLREKHSQDVEIMRQQANEAAVNELTIYESKVKSLNDEINSYKSALLDKDKEKNIEISKLKLEYDRQLQKLRQKQLAHAHSAGGIATKNDIFRKKLQHHQAESEKEVQSLKSTISEQQKKISDLHQQVDGLKKHLQDDKKQFAAIKRQNEKILRQNQNELLTLRSQLNEERSKNVELARLLQEQKEELENSKLTVATSKRRKSMFNPQANYLGTPKL